MGSDLFNKTWRLEQLKQVRRKLDAMAVGRSPDESSYCIAETVENMVSASYRWSSVETGLIEIAIRIQCGTEEGRTEHMGDLGACRSHGEVPESGS